MVTDAICIESGARFQCVPDCGFCCGFWDIHVDLVRKDVLLEKDWVKTMAQDLQKREALPLFKIIGQKENAVIQRQHGTCSFINDRQLCSIHAAEGYDAKPVACQQYPFIYFETPRGLEVFLDHSCPEVIQNNGEVVTVEEVQNWISNEHIHVVGLPIPLTSDLSLDWESYLILEEVFLSVLAQPLSYDERILCLHQIVFELSRQLSSHCDTNATRAALQVFNSIDVVKMLAKTRSQPSSPSKRDLYIAILIQLVESVYSGEVGVERLGMFGMLNKVLRQWKRVGQNDFHVFGFHVKYTDIDQIAYQVEMDPCREIMNRYLLHLVRKLVGTGRIPIIKRISIIATNFAMVKWFSRAYAASKQRPRVIQEDIVFAIKVVEKFLGNSLFNKMEKERNFLSNYVNFLYENPQLPGTMLSD